MKHNTVLLTAALLCISILSSAQTVTETTVSMSDGVQLDAFTYRPATPPPAEGYPAILFVHGYSGSKNDMRPSATAYAADGYVTVAYSVRGQGASGGTFDFFNSDRLLADLRAMIDYTATQPDVNPSRVGVAGGSQGGLHAWFAAAYEMPVRAVVSIIANGRFSENWAENGAMNYIFSLVGLMQSVRMDPAVRDMLEYARNTGDYDSGRVFLARYSTNSLETKVKVPTAIIVAGHDAFFNQNAAIRQFSNLTVPSRFVLYPGGHDLPSDKNQSNYVTDLMKRWFAWWLKGDPSVSDVASPDSAVVHFDGGTGQRRVFQRQDEGVWLAPDAQHPEVRELQLYISNRGLMADKPVNQEASKISYIPLLGSQPAVFRSEPQAKDITLAPLSSQVTLYVTATNHPYQLNILLFDLDPSGKRKPIGRGHMQVEVNAGQSQLLQFELTRMLHTLKAGHVLEAQIHGGVSLVPDLELHFGNIVLPPTVAAEISLQWGGNEASMFRFYILDDQTTSSASAATMPADIELLANYPNPFSASTYIPLQLSTSRYIRAVVYSAAGKEIAVLYDGTMEAGSYALYFDAASLLSGVYFCRVESSSGIIQKQMLLLR